MTYLGQPSYLPFSSPGRFSFLQSSKFLRVVRGDPLAIASASDLIHPLFILQIPVDCLADPALESFTRLPTQLALDLARINRVAPIVAGTVLDERDQFSMWQHRIVLAQFVQNRARGFHDVDVTLFVPAADVMGLP